MVGKIAQIWKCPAASVPQTFYLQRNEFPQILLPQTVSSMSCPSPAAADIALQLIHLIVPRSEGRHIRLALPSVHLGEDVEADLAANGVAQIQLCELLRQLADHSFPAIAYRII